MSIERPELKLRLTLLGASIASTELPTVNEFLKAFYSFTKE
jgi:hypothetical protein